MADILSFRPSRPYTIGAELELQLLDPETLDLTSAAPSLLKILPEDFRTRIKPEFIQSMVEIASGICSDVDELAADLRVSIKTLEELAGRAGCLLYSSSLHPFAAYRRQLVSPGKRYAALMEELQISGRRLITQGLHVHVGLADGPTAIRVCNSIRQYLPLLLALTTSSPYYGGEDTGFHSYRSRLLDSLARAGMPHPFDDWSDFQALLRTLNRTGIIADIRDIWWDVRPHPDLGTIEVRICDLPGRFTEIIAIAALVQSLVMTLAEKTEPHNYPPLELIATNKWQAARHGLDGKFIDSAGSGSPMPMRQAARRLLERTAMAAGSLGSQATRGAIENIIDSGSGSTRQREIYAATGDFRAMINSLRESFWS